MYKEDNRTELKEILTDNVKKEIVGFLNSTGGVIYVGVKDNGELSPINDLNEQDEMSLKISSWISDAFYPETSRLIDYDFNSDNVFEIRVKEGTEKPYYLKDKGPKPSGVYRRTGTSVRKATDNEILLMIMDSKNYSFEAEESEEQDLTFEYFFNECDKQSIEHSRRNLVSLKMVNKNDRYTNLAYLLSDQSNITIKFAIYDRSLNFKLKKQFSGSIIKSLNELLETVTLHNDVSAVFDKNTFKRMETISYPGLSLREGIVNAIGHANYFLRSNIKVEFFPEECKITNPGGIYQATLDDILSGVQTYRNPGLINILDKLGYIENFGSGIPRIKDAYKNTSIKPTFDPSINFFILRLPNLNYYNVKPVSDYYEDLKDFDARLLNIISNNPGLNASELLTKFEDENVTLDMIKNSLKRNLSKYTEFKGSPKNGGYYIKEN